MYAGQETTVRTGHGTTDWFQIRKGVHQDCILSPCLFNLYAEYIMRNTDLDEAQAGIKIMLGAGALGRPRGMEWGGRRVQDGEHMYTCGGFILIFGKTNTIM